MPLSLKFKTPVETPRAARNKWAGCSAEHVSVPRGEAYEFAYTGTQHYLALHDMCLSDGELDVDSLAAIRGRDLRDTLTFVPKGCKISGWAQPAARDNAFTAIYFDPLVMNEELGARYRQRSPAPAIYTRDPALQITMEKIRSLVKTPGSDALHAEALCLTAALEVLGITPGAPAGRLSDRQMAVVRAFIDGCMGQHISLSDLAGAVGLSRFHFSRAFKATTGQSPYHFVATLRVEAASRILKTSELGVEAVATTVGFTSVAQFRRAFYDRMGMTPHAFRQST